MEQLTVVQKLARISGEIGPVGKDEQNGSVKFKYRSIDAIINRLNPLLSKYEVVMSCKVLEWNMESREIQKQDSQGRTYVQVSHMCSARVQYCLQGTQGPEDKICTEALASAIDYSDKAATQCMTMAQKYALIQLFAIPTEDVDPDGRNNTIQIPQPAPTPQVKQIPDEKMSHKILEDGNWDGSFLGEKGNIIELTFQGQTAKYSITDMGIKTCTTYLAKKAQSPVHA